MASLISDIEPTTNSNPTSTDLVRRKKRISSSSSSSASSSRRISDSGRWRSEKQQRIYSSKLFQALQQVRHNSSSSSSSSSSSAATSQKRGKAVREAADRALAVSARGKTLWSRAILANRIKLKFRKQKRPKPSHIPSITTVVTTGSNRRSKKRRVSVVGLSKKSIPTVNRKVRVLGRLVPGCGKETVPVILEEATDYIQALEMQVRAMNSLMELLSRSAPPSQG